jgi:hypothetical protein
MHNHAQAIVACDFFVVITASFRILYGFVVMGWLPAGSCTAACITNTGWKRWRRDAGRNYCGLQPRRVFGAITGGQTR